MNDCILHGNLMLLLEIPYLNNFRIEICGRDPKVLKGNYLRYTNNVLWSYVGKGDGKIGCIFV